MPDYPTLKILHMAAALLSIAGFVLRYLWMLAGSSPLQARPVKVVPHIVDTVLLASAVLLAVQAGLAPWSSGWLGFKVIALIIYVGLGTVALKRGRSKPVRAFAGAAAIALFATIVWVARYKSLPLLGPL